MQELVNSYFLVVREILEPFVIEVVSSHLCGILYMGVRGDLVRIGSVQLTHLNVKLTLKFRRTHMTSIECGFHVLA